MAQLASRREYATGEVPFPGGLARADAIAIAADAQTAVDLATEARAKAIAATGAQLACKAGCAACCDQLVGVFAAEAELIADWLRAPEQGTVQAAFLAAYPRWREQTGDRLARIVAATGTPAEMDIVMEQWLSRVRCAFNHDGLCSIYPVRPSVCRACHAVDTPDLCHPADGKDLAPRTMHFVPLENLRRKLRGLELAMHHALDGPRLQAEALCEAIYQRLTHPPPAPAGQP
jgi:Fe-S-cluster containining protein